ncbi:hypothetical protein BH20ACI4_BH20ACI4_28510 [soil metagenome]
MSEFNEEKYANCEKIKNRLYEIRVGKKVVVEAPKVSVVIPAYKIAPFVKETLDSVLTQIYKNFEIILVNDGSPDTEKLEKKLAPYFDKIIYAKQENAGVSKARNAAICLARGELIAFLDGDDQWLPEFLESQINYLEINHLDMVYCDALLFGENYQNTETFAENAPSNGVVSPISLLSAECNVITSGTILRKAVFAKTDLFDATLPFMQDFDLWLRLAKAGLKISYQRKVLVKYRITSEGLSGNNVERAWRNIRALTVAEAKHELSRVEREAWERQMRLSNAEYETEKGKLCLTMKDFSEARQHFIEANNFDHKLKLTVLIYLLKFAPNLTFQLFKKFRSSEFSFISSE